MYSEGLTAMVWLCLRWLNSLSVPSLCAFICLISRLLSCPGQASSNLLCPLMQLQVKNQPYMEKCPFLFLFSHSVNAFSFTIPKVDNCNWDEKTCHGHGWALWHTACETRADTSEQAVSLHIILWKLTEWTPIKRILSDTVHMPVFTKREKMTGPCWGVNTTPL